MNRKALIAGVAVAALGVGLLFFYMRRYEHEVTGGDPVGVLMVTSDLAIGEPLTADRMAVRPIPQRYGEPLTADRMAVRPIPQRYVEDRHILATDQDRVIGIRLATSVRANQSLLWTDLATAFDGRRDLSNLLREGMRALTVAVGRTSAIVELLRPGDRVDILFTSARPGAAEEMVTVTLLQNVLVLAVGEDTGGDTQDQEEQRTRDVSVAVTMEQATLLAHARTRGQLELTLRNPEDIELVEDLGETTDTDLIEPEQRRRIQRRQPREEQAIEQIR